MNLHPARIGILSLAALLLLSGPAAAESKLIDVFGDWNAFTDTENGQKICYIGSAPTKEEGKYSKRGDTFILVTHRPAEKSVGVISIAAGYTYKKDSDVQVIIGGKTFALFSNGDHGWAEDAKTDRALVRAMRGGSKMAVKGVSARGTRTTDTYSLKGFTAAYKAASTACGL
ncbi:MAG: hypothetical protein ISR52_04390 [Rhodospirillales bacterium]|nr:hypothetical protein [Rhodospirillales bacterium]